jgi:3-oxoacyl-[acyl-carrier protein] reductase
MFDDQLVFITGGATGIGAATVERFAMLGADVACCYNKSHTAAKTLAASLHDRGLSIFTVHADVSEGEEVRAAIEATVTHFGNSISILVNNAGDNINPTPVETMDETIWARVIGINLTGPFLCAKYCIPGMKASGGGRIINITSISARTGGGPGSAHYVASKAGLEGFTRSLAKELASYNITVNGIAPGVVYTPIHERTNTPESLERLRQNIPLMRIGGVDEVARVVTFLASEDASFITGEIVAVNGGMRMD